MEIKLSDAYAFAVLCYKGFVFWGVSYIKSSIDLERRPWYEDSFLYYSLYCISFFIFSEIVVHFFNSSFLLNKKIIIFIQSRSWKLNFSQCIKWFFVVYPLTARYSVYTWWVFKWVHNGFFFSYSFLMFRIKMRFYIFARLSRTLFWLFLFKYK